MNTNKDFALEHLHKELAILEHAITGSLERAVHLGIVLGAVSAYRNIGVLADDDLEFLVPVLVDEDDKLPRILERA